MNKEISKFRVFNKLKSVYRFNSVGERKESTAEHSWGCLILADFFLTKIEQKIDRLKVYELLMYHDVVEIEAGDSILHPDIKNIGKKELELKSAKILVKKLPQTLSKKYWGMFVEFEAQKTIESKFAKAIFALEAEIHELDYKQDWKGWTAEFLVSKKRPLFNDFPELESTFDDIVKFLIKEKYFEGN
jgi:putative hydrolase of HD superfamily